MTTSRTDVAGWAVACLLGVVAGTAVVSLEWEWPESAAALLVSLGVMALGLAMVTGLSLVEVFCASVILVSAFSGILQTVSLGPVTLLGAWSGVCAVVAGLLWLASPRQASSSPMWPFILLASLGASSLIWFQPSREGLQSLVVLSAFVLITLVTASHASAGGRLIAKVSAAFAIASWVPVAVYGVSMGLWGLGNKALVGPRALGLFSLIALAWNLPQWRYGRRSALVPIVAILATIVLSLSRSATVTALLLLPLSRIRSRPRISDWVRMIFVFGLAVGLFYAAFTYFTPLRERFTEGDVRAVGGAVSINVSGRDTMWPVTWDSYLESPWIGKGAGSAGKELFERAGLSHPHNDYLRILHDFGFVGLLLWALGFIILVRRTWRAWRYADISGFQFAHVHLAALLGLAVVGIDMITSNPIVYIFIMGPLGILVGSSLGLSTIQATPQMPSASYRAFSRTAHALSPGLEFGSRGNRETD
jgi:O-antigen ligase